MDEKRQIKIKKYFNMQLIGRLFSGSSMARRWQSGCRQYLGCKSSRFLMF